MESHTKALVYARLDALGSGCSGAQDWCFLHHATDVLSQVRKNSHLSSPCRLLKEKGSVPPHPSLTPLTVTLPASLWVSSITVLSAVPLSPWERAMPSDAKSVATELFTRPEPEEWFSSRLVEDAQSYCRGS